MSENEIAYQIRGAIYDVYNKLGPGLFELVYENALSYELKKRGLNVKSQVPINIVYNGIDMGAGFKMDLHSYMLVRFIKGNVIPLIYIKLLNQLILIVN